MKKFEYIVRQDMFESGLNELGKDGWELVNIIPYGDYRSLRYYFKREVEVKPTPTVVKFDLPKPQKLNECKITQEDVDKISGDGRFRY